MLRLSKPSTLLSLLLVACSSPAPVALSRSLVSDQGLLDVDVRVVSPVQRGDNELFVELRPHDGHDVGARASLVAVNATMAAHGHEARAETVEPQGESYHAFGLELFMSGRWQVELALELDGESDSASFPVDVP